jgi:murein DD-endopeptidase MepM/ murein hydrolase activator NlpD
MVLFPALLMAQAPAESTPAESKPNQKSPAYSQPSDFSVSDTQTSPPQTDKASASGTAAAAKPAPKAPSPYPVMSAAAKQRAQQLYEYLVRGQSAQLYAAFSPGMKKGSSQARVVNVSKQINVKLGTPRETLAESYLPGMTQPVTVYSRALNFSKGQAPVLVVIAVNEQGELDSMQITPVRNPPADNYTDYLDKTKLHLPFDSTWMVTQGGRKLYQNAYVASDDDRYGVGFVFLKDGRPFDNDGKQNEDFYCYGQPVLAPAAGTVVQTVNNAVDHPPGKQSDTISRGNYVVISHGNNEFSLIPYLKSGSVKVRNGQRVKAGDTVGQCGNSGNSFAPHVEYRLQNTRGFPLPQTMPAQFVDYVADGKNVASGEPVRGQSVANQEKAPSVETAAKPQ